MVNSLCGQILVRHFFSIPSSQLNNPWRIHRSIRSCAVCTCQQKQQPQQYQQKHRILPLRRSFHQVAIAGTTIASPTQHAWSTKNRRIVQRLCFPFTIQQRKGHFYGPPATATPQKNTVGENESLSQPVPPIDWEHEFLKQKSQLEERYLSSSSRALFDDEAAATNELNQFLQIWFQWWTSSSSSSASTSNLQCPKPAEMLQWIDDSMAKQAKAFRRTLQPDLFTYNYIIDAIVEQDHVESHRTNKAKKVRGSPEPSSSSSENNARAALAESILTRMIRLIVSDWGHPPFNMTFVFHKVMKLHCDAQDHARAEKLLDLLEQLNDHELMSDQASLECPAFFQLSCDTYTLLIGSYAKKGAPREAELILFKLLKRAEEAMANKRKPDKIVLPYRAAFESVLNAWVTASDFSAGQRAEWVIAKMHEWHDQTHSFAHGPTDTKPTVKTYSKVVSAWVNSRHKDALGRVMKILEAMREVDWGEEQSDSNAFRKAMVDMYLQAMKLCSFSGEPEKAPQMCLKMLSHLDDLVGLCNIKPTKLQKLYANVIFAWAKSSRRDKVDHVEKVYHELEEKLRQAAKDLDSQAFLHSSVYDALFTVYADAGDRKRSEELLNKMLREYMEHREKVFDESMGPAKPTIKMMNSVILACSRYPRSAKAAEEYFLLISELGNWCYSLRMNPDIVSYNALLSAFGETNDMEIAKKGDQYFQKLIEDGSIMPTTVTYNMALLLWVNLNSPEALLRAHALLSEMELSKDIRIKPDYKSYTIYLSMLKKSTMSEEDKMDRIEDVQRRINRLSKGKRR